MTSPLTVQEDESALALFRRVKSKPFRTGLPALDQAAGAGLRSGDVVEVRGPSGAAKTEVMLNVTTQYALPEDLGGEGKPVVFFDLDNRFNILRLCQLITARIQCHVNYLTGAAAIPHNTQPEPLPQLTPTEGGGFSHSQAAVAAAGREDAQKLMLAALSRVKVVAPAGGAELLVCVEALRAELARAPPTLIVIDSLGAFQARDRVSAGAEGMQSALMSQLAGLLRDHPVVLFAARTEFSASARARGGADFMPDSWTKLVTHRLTLARQRSAAAPPPPPLSQQQQQQQQHSVFSMAIWSRGASAAAEATPQEAAPFVVTDGGIIGGAAGSGALTPAEHHRQGRHPQQQQQQQQQRQWQQRGYS